MSILDTIVEDVRREIEKRLETRPFDDLDPPRNKLSLVGAILRARKVPLIAEVKRTAPSTGPIRPDADPLALASEMVAGGAVGISVLTERKYFNGDPTFLRILAQRLEVPLLMKDFVIDPYQIEEAYRLGADAVLLIARILGDRLPKFVRYVEKFGMEPLVEVFDESDLQLALSTDATLIGINNRDLSTMKVSLTRTEKIAPLVPRDRIVVSESGISTPEDIQKVVRAGARAVLVGTAIVRAGDIKAKTEELVGALSRAD
jgi:indole-3-glycerol phosphate synthase